MGTEAYSLIIKFGFEALKLHRLYSGMTLTNKGMIKVSEKSGMKYEGIAREALYKDGTYRDLVHYAIINPNQK